MNTVSTGLYYTTLSRDILHTVADGYLNGYLGSVVLVLVLVYRAFYLGAHCCGINHVLQWDTPYCQMFGLHMALSQPYDTLCVPQGVIWEQRTSLASQMVLLACWLWGVATQAQAVVGKWPLQDSPAPIWCGTIPKADVHAGGPLTLASHREKQMRENSGPAFYEMPSVHANTPIIPKQGRGMGCERHVR